MKTSSLHFIMVLILCFGCKGQDSPNKLLLNIPADYENDALKAGAYKFLVNNMQGLKHVKNDMIIKDVFEVDQKYLIKNIDLACDASKDLLRHNVISVQDFYEYVLPYRLNFGKIDNWREASFWRSSWFLGALHSVRQWMPA